MRRGPVGERALSKRPVLRGGPCWTQHGGMGWSEVAAWVALGLALVNWWTADAKLSRVSKLVGEKLDELDGRMTLLEKGTGLDPDADADYEPGARRPRARLTEQR